MDIEADGRWSRSILFLDTNLRWTAISHRFTPALPSLFSSHLPIREWQNENNSVKQQYFGECLTHIFTK